MQDQVTQNVKGLSNSKHNNRIAIVYRVKFWDYVTNQVWNEKNLINDSLDVHIWIKNLLKFEDTRARYIRSPNLHEEK